MMPLSVKQPTISYYNEVWRFLMVVGRLHYFHNVCGWTGLHRTLDVPIQCTCPDMHQLCSSEISVLVQHRCICKEKTQNVYAQLQGYGHRNMQEEVWLHLVVKGKQLTLPKERFNFLHNAPSKFGSNCKIRKGPIYPDGYQVEHELVTCPWIEEGQEHVLH